VVSRSEIARVLVASLTSDAADRKTLELVAEKGPAQTELDPLFAALKPDWTGALDGVLDRDNMPIAAEPASVLAELDAVRGRF
jgi:chemotaxis regulatin CheY-phosphate phosphatase CheZ